MSELRWGETPFDRCDRAELIRHAQRLYAALVETGSALRLCGLQGGAFFGPEGSGGRALEMARQALEPLHTAYDAEDIYRSFFRYAHDLLFTQEPIAIGSGWQVCNVCGTMVGRSTAGTTREGQACIKPHCSGTYHPLTWQDLAIPPEEPPHA